MVRALIIFSSNICNGGSPTERRASGNGNGRRRDCPTAVCGVTTVRRARCGPVARAVRNASVVTAAAAAEPKIAARAIAVVVRSLATGSSRSTVCCDVHDVNNKI